MSRNSDRLLVQEVRSRWNENSIGNIEIKLMHVDKYLNNKMNTEPNQITVKAPPSFNLKQMKKSVNSDRNSSLERDRKRQASSSLYNINKKNSYSPYTTHARNNSGSYVHRNESVFLKTESPPKSTFNDFRRTTLRMRTEPRQPVRPFKNAKIKTHHDFKLFVNTKISESKTKHLQMKQKPEQTRTPIKDLTFYLPERERKYRRKIMKKISENLHTRSFLI